MAQSLVSATWPAECETLCERLKRAICASWLKHDRARGKSAYELFRKIVGDDDNPPRPSVFVGKDIQWAEYRLFLDGVKAWVEQDGPSVTPEEAKQLLDEMGSASMNH